MKAEYTAAPFWFWNGKMDEEEIVRQLRLMKDNGVRQPIIHARFGLETEYLSEEWFACVRATVDFCRANDMKLWIYDENNWPSGNCSWTITKEEKFREKFLQYRVYEAAAGETISFDRASRKYLCIAWVCGGEMHRIDASRAGEFTPDRTAQIWEVWYETDPYEPIGKLCVDYMNREAIARFITLTHEEYYRRFSDDFGETILGFFMDETRFCNAMPWTESFAEEFHLRKGYDILPNLPYLWLDADQSWKIRYDYYDVVSSLMNEAAYRQIYDWCEAHGVLTTGHFLGEETLATQAYFMGDIMRYYRYLHIPGIDHLGRGIGSLNAKFAVSAAHSYGKNRISCESFGGAGWDTGYEDVVRIANWLIQSGINMVIPHGFYYSIEGDRKNDWPPSYFYQWKDWEKFPCLAKMIVHAQSLLSDLLPEGHVLVLCPINTYFTVVRHNLDLKTYFKAEGPFLEPDEAKQIDMQFQLLCNGLSDQNTAYSILHSDAVEHYAAENGKIVNRLTGVSYGTVILPCVRYLTRQEKKLFDRFAESGGTMYLYQSEVQGILDDGTAVSGWHPECREDSLDVLLQKVCDAEDVWYQTDPRVRTRHLMNAYPQRLIDPYIHDGENLDGIGTAAFSNDNRKVLTVVNYCSTDKSIGISLIGCEVPILYDPETGEKGELSREDCGEGCRVAVEVPANRMRMLIMERETKNG